MHIKTPPKKICMGLCWQKLEIYEGEGMNVIGTREIAEIMGCREGVVTLHLWSRNTPQKECIILH